MDSQISHFAGLSDSGRKTASPLLKLAAGDRLELHVRREGGQELSPTEAAAVLGISRPLVVLRMESGDLPFRYVANTAAPC